MPPTLYPLPALREHTDQYPQFVPHAVQAARHVEGAALVVLSGSHAYGTERPDSDADMLGVYVAPLRDVLGLTPPNGVREINPKWGDAKLYELHRFCKLAASCNPSILDILAAPVLLSSPVGRALRANQHLFVSKTAVKTYGGYATSQLRKAEAGTGGSRGVAHLRREKFLMHTLRLLVQGRKLLEDGEVTVRLTTEEADMIWLRASAGLSATRKLAGHLFEELDAAAERSSLPDRPDTDRINDLILTLRGVA